MLKTFMMVISPLIKKGWAETSESNNAGRENAERGYNLIMKNKEKLLSFSNPVRFIFSHSALKEGWDNPMYSRSVAFERWEVNENVVRH
jgi:hypothetical protein